MSTCGWNNINRSLGIIFHIDFIMMVQCDTAIKIKTKLDPTPKLGVV